MVSQANNNMKFLNLVSRLIDQTVSEDNDEDMFCLPEKISVEELLTARKTLPEDKFFSFMEHAQNKHPATYHALESLISKGYEWEDPFSSSAGGSIAKKVILGPLYILRCYRDHEFERTGDYTYAYISAVRIRAMSIICATLLAPMTPLAIFFLAWAGLGYLSAMGDAFQKSEDLSDFQTMKDKYDYIHQRSRFFILDKIQHYFKSKEQAG